MFDYSATYTDQYELTMAQVYFHKGQKDDKAIFDYFFRKNPFDGGYTILAGLEDLLQALEHLQFQQDDIDFLSKQGMDREFLVYLENFRFRGNIYAAYEGDLIFPNRPVLSVEASIIEAQIIETLLLNILNYQSLIATKARRMRLAAGDDHKLVDFGLRRAPGPGGYYASRAAIIGGFDSTSNVRSARDYKIPVSGTMAHSFVQSYDQEIDSFRDFAEVRADDCVLLVDTYDTLKSGVPNAITVGKEMEKRGDRLKGIRLDSGDLSWLAKKSRKMLDDAGLKYVKIAASNQMDEYVIKSLLEQKAPIDLFGVGTSLVTGRPDAALDGVYKLAYAGNKSRLKLSETPAKINLPGKKQVYRILNNDNTFYGAEVVTKAEEKEVHFMIHPSKSNLNLSFSENKTEPLLHKVIEDGNRQSDVKSVEEITDYSHRQLKRLPGAYKRFDNPHVYKIGLSKPLKEERDNLIRHYKKKGG